MKTLRAASHLELDPITFRQRLEPVHLDGGEVNEHVLTTLLGDESKTLRLVELLLTSWVDATLFSAFAWRPARSA